MIGQGSQCQHIAFRGAVAAMQVISGLALRRVRFSWCCNNLQRAGDAPYGRFRLILGLAFPLTY